MVTSDSEGSVAHLAVIETDGEVQRNLVRARFLNAGINTAIHYPITDNQQPGLPRPLNEAVVPIAERASQRIFSLPCFPGLTEMEIAHICQELRRGWEIDGRA